MSLSNVILHIYLFKSCKNASWVIFFFLAVCFCWCVWIILVFYGTFYRMFLLPQIEQTGDPIWQVLSNICTQTKQKLDFLHFLYFFCIKWYLLQIINAYTGGLIFRTSHEAILIKQHLNWRSVMDSHSA